MAKSLNTVSPAPAITTVAPAAEKPLVKPSEAKGGDESGPAAIAALNLQLSSGVAARISERAERAKELAIHATNTKQAIADYFATLADHEANIIGAKAFEDAKETATANVSRAFADAILADAMTRVEARQKLGEAFGFAVSTSTGKPTSKPMEPGNTIAKRVSSVTIACEYALTGELPEKGGDSLPSVGQEKVAEILSDYWNGNITVRAASERIEAAIKEARVTIPLEMDAEKLIKLAGKIQTASEAIGNDPALSEAYVILLETIAALPLSAE